MASIVKRNNRYCVVYTYKHTNGTLKQKWETFTDLAVLAAAPHAFLFSVFEVGM